jgi:hypothetical protein
LWKPLYIFNKSEALIQNVGKTLKISIDLFVIIIRKIAIKKIQDGVRSTFFRQKSIEWKFLIQKSLFLLCYTSGSFGRIEAKINPILKFFKFKKGNILENISKFEFFF